MDGAPENARKKKNSSYLRMREGRSFAVGAYLNRDGCTAGIVDICGEIAAKRRLHLSGFRAGDKLDPLVDAVDDMIYESGVAPERIIESRTLGSRTSRRKKRTDTESAAL